MTKLETALLLAERVHSNQTYDMFPYMYHIRKVVELAQDFSFDETIQVACALHDSLEDSELSYNDIFTLFGGKIAEIVFCVTDELGRNRKERKEKTYPKIQSNPYALIVKLLDRIANVSHSKQFSPKLFEMYKKEHTEFRKQLYRHDASKVLWDKLDELFK